MDEQKPEEHPMLRATLTSLQLIAMGLCALVLMNMSLDERSSPVPECPLKAVE